MCFVNKESRIRYRCKREFYSGILHGQKTIMFVKVIDMGCRDNSILLHEITTHWKPVDITVPDEVVLLLCV